MDRVAVFVSDLEAPAEAVWAHATSMRGVNEELGPYLCMTHPPGLDRLDAAEVPIGQKLFRSWLLALSLVPVEYDDLAFEAVGPGMRFAERSTMLTMRIWCHEREVRPRGERACTIMDRVACEPRLRVTAPFASAIVGAVFRHRHARLRAKFGGVAGASPASS
jgi:ligand-binding SRPBCC domain-containing protein